MFLAPFDPLSFKTHGAITYAAFKLLQQHGTPTGMTWNWAEQVEGTLLQFTNADQSRTSASIYMHDNRLYIIEGDVPKGYPEPELFKMSIGFIRPGPSSFSRTARRPAPGRTRPTPGRAHSSTRSRSTR